MRRHPTLGIAVTFSLLWGCGAAPRSPSSSPPIEPAKTVSVAPKANLPRYILRSAGDDKMWDLIATDGSGHELFPRHKTSGFVTNETGDVWALRERGNDQILERVDASDHQLWKVPVVDAEWRDLVKIYWARDRVVVAANLYYGLAFFSVRAVDGQDASPLRKWIGYRAHFVDDRSVLWASRKGNVVRFHPNGEILSETRVSSAAADPARAPDVTSIIARKGGGAFVSTADSNLGAVDSDGKLGWSRSLEESILGLDASHSDDSILVQMEHSVASVNGDGTSRWTFRPSVGSIKKSETLTTGETRVITSVGAVIVLDKHGVAARAETEASWALPTKKDAPGLTLHATELELRPSNGSYRFERVVSPHELGAREATLVALDDGSADAFGKLETPFHRDARTGKWAVQHLRVDRTKTPLHGAMSVVTHGSELLVAAIGMVDRDEVGLLPARTDVFRISDGRAQLLPKLGIAGDNFRINSAVVGVDSNDVFSCAGRGDDSHCVDERKDTLTNFDLPIAVSDIAVGKAHVFALGTNRELGSVVLRRDGDRWTDLGFHADLPPSKIVANADDDVWVLAGAYATPTGRQSTGSAGLFHFDGMGWRALGLPIEKPTDLWVPKANEVWIAGEEGLVRFDGKSWSHIEGAGRELTRVTGNQQGMILTGGTEGIFEGHPLGAAQTPHDAIATVTLVAGGEVLTPKPITTQTAPFHLERAQIVVKGHAPLDYLSYAVAAPSGDVWLGNDSRNAIASDGRALERASSNDTLGLALAAISGSSAFATHLGGLVSIDAKTTTEVGPLGTIRALAVSPTGELWIATVPADGQASFHMYKNGTLTHLFGSPDSVTTAIAARSDHDVWSVGGLADVGPQRDSPTPFWPVGVGRLGHFDGAHFDVTTVASGSLLAVAIAGPDTWAVGTSGAMVRSREGKIEAFSLPGAPLLRSVFASGPNDVWMVGDDATVIHFDGKEFSHVDPKGVPKYASFTCVFRLGGDLFAAGPSGIFRVRPLGP